MPTKSKVSFPLATVVSFLVGNGALPALFRLLSLLLLTHSLTLYLSPSRSALRAASSSETHKMVRPNVHRANLPTAVDFMQLGLVVMKREKSRACARTQLRRFKAFFGAKPKWIALQWRFLYKSGWLEFAGVNPNPVHLLWTFLWLKRYDTEEVGASLAGTDEKTYREKVWFYLRGMARLANKFVRRILFANGVGRLSRRFPTTQLSHRAFFQSKSPFLSTDQVGEQIYGR